MGDVQASSPHNIQAVAQFLKQYYSPTDLKSFFSQYYTPAQGRTVQEVIEPNEPRVPVASLDIEARVHVHRLLSCVTAALAPPSTSWRWAPT